MADPIGYLYRFAFPLGAILDGLETRHGDLGYAIDGVNHDIPKNSSGVYAFPVLWRGRGVHDVESDQDAIEKTFVEDSVGDMVISFTAIDVATQPAAGAVYTHNSSSYTVQEVDFDTTYKFTVSSVVQYPVAGKTYTNNGATFTVIRTSTNIVVCSGTGVPAASGTLTQADGLYGDATITFSSYQQLADGTIEAMRDPDDTTDPASSGTLTKSSGTGDSSISFTSRSDISDYTDGEWEVTWHDILKIASIYRNAFVMVKPKVESGVLKVDIDIRPRRKTADASPITAATWIERKRLINHYAVQGAIISTGNYDMPVGNTDARYLLEKTIPVSEPLVYNENSLVDLYLGITQQKTGSPGYDYTRPDEVFWDGYFTSLLEVLYDDYLDGVTGFEGTVIPYYDDSGTDKALRILDQLNEGSDYMQIISIKLKKRGFAAVKAMEMEEP